MNKDLLYSTGNSTQYSVMFYMGKYIKKSVKGSESESCSVLSNSLRPHGLYTVHGILQARILEWVAYPFSRGSSGPRNQTGVSRIAGGFFTNWATRETQEYWSG